MACAGVVASAGAQLDFTVMTVGSRNVTVGKSTNTHFGFDSSTSTGSLSNPTLEFASGTVYTCTRLEDQVTDIRISIDGTSTNTDAASFRRLVIDDLSLNRSAATASTNDWVWGSITDDAISSKNGSTIIVQLRAD